MKLLTKSRSHVEMVRHRFWYAAYHDRFCRFKKTELFNAKFINDMLFNFLLWEVLLKGQSHEKVGELRVWGGSLGPN
jgi:hypothetical protein